MLILLLIVIAIMRYFDGFLINDVCTGGIVSFEFSKDVATAQSYMESWGETGRIAAGLSLGLDFLFPLVYSLFIALLIHKLNKNLWSGTSLYAFGNVLLWCQFVAALFDYVENYGLIRLLLGDMQVIWASLAYYFAAGKFILILMGIGYVLLNFGVFLMKKIK